MRVLDRRRIHWLVDGLMHRFNRRLLPVFSVVLSTMRILNRSRHISQCLHHAILRAQGCIHLTARMILS